MNGGSIYNGFEYGAYLAGSFYLIVLEIFEIHPAYPGFDFSGLRVHCNQSRLKYFQIMFDGVDRRVLHSCFSLIRTVNQHRFFGVHRFHDFRFAQSLAFQALVSFTALYRFGQEFRMLVPRFFFSELFVIRILEAFHVEADRFFGITLHFCVDG